MATRLLVCAIGYCPSIPVLIANRDGIMIGDKTFLDATSLAKKLPDSEQIPPSPEHVELVVKKRAYHEAWRRANKKHVRSWQRRYYWANKDKVLGYNRKFRYKNHIAWKAYMREYMRKWRLEHPHYVCPKEQMRRRKHEQKKIKNR